MTETYPRIVPTMMPDSDRYYYIESCMNRSNDAQCRQLYRNTWSEEAMKLLYSQLYEKMNGYEDGYEFEVEHGIYTIRAVYHVSSHEERGGDQYMGVWEMVSVIDSEEIEIVDVYDNDSDAQCPQLVDKLNKFFKKNYN